MCGIAGIWRFNSKVTKQEIVAITDSMIHRGPDASGYEIFENANIALGHRRLSILDLSNAGIQPMFYANKRYCLSFNGEIYNFIEIKKELIQLGYQFVSETDSEVILAAFDAWKTECFAKFNGMWAIAIWDNKTEQLLLCRDRFGVKPLHFAYIKNEFFAFASETIAFKYIANFKRSYNTQNLLIALAEHNLLEPAGETIYNNIHQLLPGTYMIIDKNRNIETKRWWQLLNNLPIIPKSFEQQKEKFLEIFTNACKLRLRSDVTIASALSGGVDSTAVYCMLGHVMNNNAEQRAAKNWQQAFSITFPKSKIDERIYIEDVLKNSNGIGHIIEPNTNNLAHDIIQSTKLSDFISGTPLLCLTDVYKAMHLQGVTVSMDGHGVDEYLYGYKTSVQKALLNAYITNDFVYAKSIEQTLINMCFENEGVLIIEQTKIKSKKLKEKNIFNKFKINISNTLKKNSYTINQQSLNDFYNLKSTSLLNTNNVYNIYNTSKNIGEQSLLEEFMYKDMPYNLRDFDRGAMQHQIEIRMPFMDFNLVSYCMALPQKSKLKNGYTKYILRESMKNIMPESIRNRTLKIGLGSPLADWLNKNIGIMAVDLVKSNKMKNFQFLNINNIISIVEKQTKEKTWTESSAQKIWPILNLLLLEEN